MASSYSADLKLELMVTGENAGTWGDKTNTNLNLVQQAIAGFEQVTLSSGGTLALVMTDGALSNARNMVIKFATATIAASTVCTIPDSIEKFYIFDCTGLTNPSNLTIKTASGTGFSPDRAAIFAAYSDGTNLKEVSLDTLGGTIGTLQVADDAITAAKISNNAVVTAGILQSNVTQNKMSPNSIGTAQIIQSNVTLNKMAPNSVGPAQLQSTAVTAGSYTTADITVDEDGRITAASTGAAGSNDFVRTFFKDGPATVDFVAQPGTTKLLIYACAGGASGAFKGTQQAAGPGGNGGGGIFSVPVSSPAPSPFTAPMTIGAGGPGSPQGGPGQAGNDTTFGQPAVITCTAGQGGSTVPAPNNLPPNIPKFNAGGASGTVTSPHTIVDITTETGFNSNPIASGNDTAIKVQYEGAMGIDHNAPNQPASGKIYGVGGNTSAQPGVPQQGNQGAPGVVIIFEDKLS